MKRFTSGCIVFVLTALLCLQVFAQTTFYDPTVVQNIEIYFSQPNWDYQMDTAKYGADGYTHADSVVLNGIKYTNVGVKYKGNSSYDSAIVKNPLHIELDHFVSQSHQGIKDIKLSNGYGDPSMIREVLSYDILGNYMICSRSNFAKVYINGDYIGLYTNTESIGKTFCSDNFGSSSNTFIKANPLITPGPSTKSNLKYISADSSSYFNFYEIKSEYGWSDLRQLCDIVTNQPSQAQNYLDIDKVLWMLAYNSVLVNLDSYSGVFSQNYYLYRDNAGIYNPIIWDLNMSFGAFPFVGNSNSSMGSLSIGQMQQLSPVVHETDQYWPLINLVLNDPLLRKFYFAHIRTINNEIFASGLYEDKATAYQSLVEPDVLADENKFFSYEQFQAGMTGNVTFGSYMVPGISTLMNARVSYLQSNSEFSAQPPVIIALSADSYSPALGMSINFTAHVTAADEVYLYYKKEASGNFSSIQMFDDGAHNDGLAGDLVYGCAVEMTSMALQYYSVAVNSQAAAFLPERAAHEFLNINAAVYTPSVGEVVVNEFLAKNENGQVNETGIYADWIELYNNTDQTLDLYGLFLSDNPGKPFKFAFPQNSLIGPNDFMIIWADELESTSQYIHCSFKLSADGESILLSTSSGEIIDQITFGEQSADISMGRCENGTGEFMFFTDPTFGTVNCTVGITLQEAVQMQFVIFPNPASESFCFENKTGMPVKDLKLLNMQGTEIAYFKLDNDNCCNISGIATGIYIAEINFETGVKLFKKLCITRL